jgi:YHS domain-containing protein
MGTELIDVVCGRTVAVTSQHHHVHGGALYCFCSDECRARFVLDPSQFASPDASGRDRSATTAAQPGFSAGAAGSEAQPSRAIEVADSIASLRRAYRLRHQTESPGDHSNPEPSGNRGIEKVGQPASASDDNEGTIARPQRASAVASCVPVAKPEPSQPLLRAPLHAAGVEGVRGSVPEVPVAGDRAQAGAGFLSNSFLAWRERRFAAKISGELLKLHSIVSSRHPELAGRDLYRQILAARMGDDASAIKAVLEAAELTFAYWPVFRELRFSDVVNYLAASEFLASHPGSRWIHADMKQIVASRIPRDL